MTNTVDVTKPDIKSETKHTKQGTFLSKLRHSFLIKVLAVLLVLVLLPRPASAIIPALAAAIAAFVAVLTEILMVIREVIAPIIETIKRLQEQIWRRFDRDIWPIPKIGRAQGAASALQLEMNRIKRDILDQTVLSARLAPVREFETRARARTRQASSGLEEYYRNIFLPLPDAREASEDLRRVIDFQDAAVLGAFKESAKIMEAAEAQIKAINRLEDEIKQAPPGTAPILEASASAALIKSQAITQHALAELLRLGAVQTAAQSLEEKRTAKGKNSTLNLLQDLLEKAETSARGRR